MELVFNNENNKNYQIMLNDLLKDIFLDFTFWYDLDLWDDKYESYAFIDEGRIVSNICVYKTEIMFEGKLYPALSIGAVATRKEYRNKGLSRKLMEHIIDKYKDIPMYLSANDSVIDFYPKFGFKRIYEKLPIIKCKLDNNISMTKLEYIDPKVWEYVYDHKNFSTKFDCFGTENINIFHLYLGYLADCIYELPEINTMVIASKEEGTLNLIGVFSLGEVSFKEILKYLPFRGVDRIKFGFMPYWQDIEFEMEEYESDPLFVRGVSCELGDFKFPELSFT